MKPTTPPYDPERRNALVDKLEDRSISLEEAEELLEYLESDLEAAEGREERVVLMKALALVRVRAMNMRHSS